MEAATYCLWFLDWPCAPLNWWSSAASWAQAILTVGTFAFAVHLGNRRDQRDWNARQQERIDALNERLSTETHRLAESKRESENQSRQLEQLIDSTQFETAMIRLNVFRWARAIRNRVDEIFEPEYQSVADEVHAYESFYVAHDRLQIELSPAHGQRVSVGTLKLVMTIELQADRILSRRRTGKPDSAEELILYRDRLRNLLAGHREWALNQIRDFLDDDARELAGVDATAEGSSALSPG